MKWIDNLLVIVGIIMMILGGLHINDWYYRSTVLVTGVVMYVNSKIALARQL